MVGDLNKSVLTLKSFDGKDHEFVIEPFCSFKTAQVLKMLAQIRTKVNIVELLGELLQLTSAGNDDAAQANRVLAAFNAIPQLLEFAPDLILDFAALALVPNAELQAANKAPGGISAKTDEKKDFLQFECTPDAPLMVVRNFLPVVGMNFLVSELSRMDKSLMGLLGSVAKSATNEKPQTESTGS